MHKLSQTPECQIEATGVIRLRFRQYVDDLLLSSDLPHRRTHRGVHLFLYNREMVT